MQLRNRDLLRTLMRQRGYSTQTLSAGIRETGYAAISERSIRYLLAGERASTAPDVACAVCLLLGVDLDVLWLPDGHRGAVPVLPRPLGIPDTPESR